MAKSPTVCADVKKCEILKKKKIKSNNIDVTINYDI
jgi:hypothetical protein